MRIATALATLVLVSCVQPTPVGGGGYYPPGGGAWDAVSAADAAGSGGADAAAGPPGGFKPQGNNESAGGQKPATGSLPGKVDISAILVQTMQEIAAELPAYENGLAAKCIPSTVHASTLDYASQWHNYVIKTDPRFPGLDWPAVPTTPAKFLSPNTFVQQLECSNNPSGQGILNAFAIQHGIWMVDGLLDAFAEGAVYFPTAKAEVALATTDEEKLQAIYKLGLLFKTHQEGAPWQFVPKATAQQALMTDKEAQERFLGAVLFVYFHEMAHANLSHGLIKETIRQGVGKLLKRRGVPATDEQKEKITKEFLILNRSTEVQADIYAATMLKAAGFGKAGPGLFVTGITMLTLDACIANKTPQDQLEACMFGYDELSTHPPMNERMLIIEKILVNGEDLTSSLEPIALDKLRKPTCGNGTCETTESPTSCPSDCATTTSPKCGNAKCEAGESSATCPQDCGAAGPVCGNGTCESGETKANCSKDCGAAGPVCGNGLCESGESTPNCPSDCPPVIQCGNGKCEMGENSSNCLKDCPAATTFCGDLTCSAGEPGKCPLDCTPKFTAVFSCLAAKCPAQWAICTPDEFCNSVMNCVALCGCDEVCAEGCYADTNKSEATMGFLNCASQSGCADPCPTTGPVCGNGLCEAGESKASCSKDCGAAGPVCGNGLCEAGETKASCSKDCGGASTAHPCDAACGGQAPSGCYCDAACKSSGDCCDAAGKAAGSTCAGSTCAECSW